MPRGITSFDQLSNLLANDLPVMLHVRCNDGPRCQLHPDVELFRREARAKKHGGLSCTTFDSGQISRRNRMPGSHSGDDDGIGKGSSDGIRGRDFQIEHTDW